MNLSLLLSILAGVLLVVGFVGTFVPVIPGAPLAWIGLLLAFFSQYNDISILCLVVTAVVAIVVSVTDNIFPIYMTKRQGGSQAATRGSTIGLIVGLFAGPFGIIIGPFLGAFIGEMIHSQGKVSESLKSAWGAFTGFLLGTGLKMLAVSVFIVIFVVSF